MFDIVDANINTGVFRPTGHHPTRFVLHRSKTPDF